MQKYWPLGWQAVLLKFASRFTLGYIFHVIHVLETTSQPTKNIKSQVRWNYRVDLRIIFPWYFIKNMMLPQIVDKVQWHNTFELKEKRIQKNYSQDFHFARHYLGL